VALCEKAAPTGEGHSRRRRAAAKPPRGQETGASGASLCAAHGGLRENRAIMLRLPRAAHYSICEKLCARELARLSKTASQWSRADDPRHAAFFACLADRVARARGVDAFIDYEVQGGTMYFVPEKTISSMLNYLEAVERLGNTKIVERTTHMGCGAGFDPLSVDGHEDIDGRMVARARCDKNPAGWGSAILVAGQHVTRIEPHEPYDAVSYGTVVHETKLPGGETTYYVAWPDITGVRQEMMGEHGCRVVTKRPSWEPEPAWSPAQQKAIEKHARRVARQDEVADLLFEVSLLRYFDVFTRPENEIDVHAIPALDPEEWAELGVPPGHRVRIKQAHRYRYPEMWAHPIPHLSL